MFQKADFPLCSFDDGIILLIKLVMVIVADLIFIRKKRSIIHLFHVEKKFLKTDFLCHSGWLSVTPFSNPSGETVRLAEEEAAKNHFM